jgi:hypothetical protein
MNNQDNALFVYSMCFDAIIIVKELIINCFVLMACTHKATKRASLRELDVQRQIENLTNTERPQQRYYNSFFILPFEDNKACLFIQTGEWLREKKSEFRKAL